MKSYTWDARGGSFSLSISKRIRPNPICRILFKQEVCLTLAIALASASKSIATRMAMIAMTTSSSIKVNPRASRLEKDLVFVLKRKNWLVLPQAVLVFLRLYTLFSERRTKERDGKERRMDR